MISVSSPERRDAVMYDIMNTINLDEMDFIERHEFFMMLESIITEYKYKKTCESDNKASEIDWSNAALISFFKKEFFKEGEQKSEIENVNNKNKEERNDAIPDSVLDFITYIDWYIFIEMYSSEISQSIIELADDYDLVSWDDVSKIKHLDTSFLIANASRINWDIFLKTHDMEEVPIELQGYEKVVAAAGNNTDIISMKADKSIITESNIRFKKYSWIDRVAGVDGHYQDDTGLWVDTLRGQAADDAENLESDLEHNEHDAYFEPDIEL